MNATILSPTDQNIAAAAKLLREGQVVGMPTETVYGLAGSAFNESALAKIFSVKERPTFDPLIVHVGSDAKSLAKLAALALVDPTRLSTVAAQRVNLLIERFWPGPLTLVLPKTARVPDLATSGLSTVAIRMPRHSIAQSLISAAGVPLAAPSANRFGRISPTSAADVFDELGDRIALILDGGRADVGVESTVVHVSESGELTVLRPGGLAIEELAQTVRAEVRTYNNRAKDAAENRVAPGMLESHYAPRKPLVLLSCPLFLLTQLQQEALRQLAGSARQVGLLMISGSEQEAAARLEAILARPVTARCLSRSGDLSEAAHHLFAELRALDGSSAELLIAENCSEPTGLGHAIADRLGRACSKKI